MTEATQSLKYTATHEWITTDEDTITVGITEHAQSLLGDMVFVELPNVGDKVHAGDELGVLESVKAASDFYAPVSGVITEINQQVNENPALINSDPFGSGWLVKVKASDLKEINTLLDHEQYQDEITKEP